MPTLLDNIARICIAREGSRDTLGTQVLWDGDAAENGWNDRPRYETNNWNVGGVDLQIIQEAISNGVEFEDRQVESKESTLAECNEAVRTMEQHDCSQFSHLPPFMREYYARKAFRAFFGRDSFDAQHPFPVLDDAMKQRLEDEGKINDPAFRLAIDLLGRRNAIDENGNNIGPEIRKYDEFMNQRMLTSMLEAPSNEKLARLQAAYTPQQLEEKTKTYEEKQLFLAKNLFMTQLGRIDIKNEDGTAEPYTGKISELYAHGSRTALVLPPGDSTRQNMMLDAWRKRAMDKNALSKGRCATHDFYRRVVHVNGDLKKAFEEYKLAGNKWAITPSKWRYRPFTYFRNYGMNIALGGLGSSFNGNHYVDDNGQNGHIYTRAKTGSEYECGAILFGFENAAPGMSSATGQKHSSKAIGHDITPFYTNAEVKGKRYSGREVDLSHFRPEDLTFALDNFERLYRKLQQKAKTDPVAGNQFKELNEKLTGPYMTAPQLANFMTSFGMDKELAINFVRAGRSTKDVPYAQNQIPANMRELASEEVAEPVLDAGKKANMDSVRAKANYVDQLRYMWNEMASHTAFSFLNTPKFDLMEDAFKKYLNAFDNIMAGKSADGRRYRANWAELSENDLNYLKACEAMMATRGREYHLLRSSARSHQGKDRDAMSIRLASFKTTSLNQHGNTFGQAARTGFHTKKQEEEIKRNEARALLAADVQRLEQHRAQQNQANHGNHANHVNHGNQANHGNHGNQANHGNNANNPNNSNILNNANNPNNANNQNNINNQNNANNQNNINNQNNQIHRNGGPGLA